MPTASKVGWLIVGKILQLAQSTMSMGHAPQLSLENQWCAITKDGLIPFLQLFVFRQCLLLRRVADQLKSPRTPIRIFFHADVAFSLGRAFCRLGAGTRRSVVLNLLRHSNPFFCCPIGNDTNVGPRFSWKLTTTRNPIPDAPWPRIIGRRSQSQIPKLVAKFTKPAG